MYDAREPYGNGNAGYNDNGFNNAAGYNNNGYVPTEQI